MDQFSDYFLPGWDLLPGRSDYAKWVVGRCLVANIEMKREKGTGGNCCSYMQNLGYYTLSWVDDVAATVIDRSNCPSILIELTGPEISLVLCSVAFYFSF